MLDNKLVSVIINCRNSEDFLGACIESVLIQTYKYFEIILIDNQSTDNTKKIIFSYKDERIKYFVTNEFLSLGAARNFALSKCNGQYLAFIDSDDIWLPDKLESIIKKFNNQTGLVYSNVLYFNESKSYKLYSYRKIYEGNCFNNLLYDYNLCMSSCVVSNKIVKKHNIRFDKDLRVCEDLDFFLKIAYISELSYVDKTLTKYRIHSDNLTSKHLELFYDEYQTTIANLISFFKIEKDFFIRAMEINNLKKSRYLWKRKKIKEAFETLNQVNTLILKRLFHTFLLLIPYKLVRFFYKPFSKVIFDFNE